MSESTWGSIQAAASDLVERASSEGMTVRVVGSTGIRIHCARASAAMDEVNRPAKDIDVVVRARDREGLRRMLETDGWMVDRDLLVAMEGQRFAFHHPDRGIDLDVFVGKLEFCHTIELGDRWERHPTTVPIEDLLLQKLQVHDFTDCDTIDTAIVLGTHDVADGDANAELIDRSYVATLLAHDWGFHRDATANLERVREAAGTTVPLSGEHARRAREGAGRLAEAIDEAKKSVAWRMRAKVGERMQWWDDVNERVDTY